MRQLLCLILLSLPAAAIESIPTSRDALDGAAAPVQVPIRYTTLPNGLRVVISEDHSAPVVTVAVYYRIGFRLEPRGRTGFAHLFEHMMFQGSENVPKPQHVRLVNAYGGVLNGSTNFDYTNYFETMPSNALELALWLEADRMRALKVTAENLKNQQEVVKEEVRVNVLNQPYGGFDWIDLPEKAFQKWENAHNFYGDFHDLDAATVEDAQKFFRTYYSPANAALVISGDVETRRALALATKYFASIPAPAAPPLPDVDEPPQSAEKRLSQEDTLATTPALAAGYRMPPHNSRTELAALSVLTNLLVEGEGSRLYQKLVKEKQLATSVSTSILGSLYEFLGPTLYTVRVDYKPGGKAEEILKVMDEQIQDLARHGPTAQEVERARTKLRAQWLAALDTTSVFGAGLQGRPHYLAVFALFNNDPGVINRIAGEIAVVTPEQVQAVARQYLDPGKRTMIDRRPAPAPRPASFAATGPKAAKGAK